MLELDLTLTLTHNQNVNHAFWLTSGRQCFSIEGRGLIADQVFIVSGVEPEHLIDIPDYPEVRTPSIS